MATPDRRGSSTADLGGLVFDGERLRCSECGGWYRHLATHVFMAHGMLADDYRAEYGLGARVPLVVDEISETLRREALGRGTENLERWHERGTAEHERVVAKIRATKREQADEYWTERLAEVGWTSWAEATGWAEETGAGWSEIGEQLGISWQSARTAGMRAGAQLRHRSWRGFELAEAYVHEHGSLDYADGELGQFLNQARAYVRNSGKQSEIAAALDVLDPNWRLTAPERITRALATGEVFEHPAARRHRRKWQNRFTAAGWSSWTDALVWAARTGNGPPQIAQRLGTEAMQVSRSMQQHWRTLAEAGEDPYAAAAPHILPPAAGCGGALTSDPGAPAEYRTGIDAERIQCMVCGLWLSNLGRHLPVHQLTSRQYRARYGLSAGARMSGQRPRHTEPADPAQYWAPILAAHHLPTDFEAAVTWAIEQGMSAPEFARHLDVPYLRLNAALRAAGLRFPTAGDRMIAQAKTHVAAGGNLSEPPTAQMRHWLDTVRRGVREGRRSVFGPQLDQIDPQWYLTAHQRAAAAGNPYVHKATRSVRSAHRTGLARAGWDSIEQAVAWAHEHEAPASAIGIATGLPTRRITHFLTTAGHTLPTPPTSGTSFRRELIEITDHLHEHHSLTGLPEPLARWLARRHQSETTGDPLPDPWINALLDHLHPTWRTPADTSSDAGTEPHRRPNPASETADTAPAPYTVDDAWQARLTRVGWSSWTAAIDWAADRQAGLGAIADHLDVRKGDVLDQLQLWWNAHPDTLTTVTPPPDGGQLLLPGHGTHAQCPACRLWFPDAAAHYSAAHPQLPHADADNPSPATTSGKPRPRTTAPAKPAARTPTPKKPPPPAPKSTKRVPVPAPVEDPWAARLAEHGFADYHAAAAWAAMARPDDPVTALAHKLQTPKTVLIATLQTHGALTTLAPLIL